MQERRSPSRLAGKDATETPAEVRFVRVPSIAERKLGADYVAPMRLDPRVLEQMQTTIRDLETKYAESLQSQVAMLQILVEPACKGDAEARSRLYALAHDMRGLAGTFGHAIVGQFADSLCREFASRGLERRHRCHLPCRCHSRRARKSPHRSDRHHGNAECA